MIWKASKFICCRQKALHISFMPRLAIQKDENKVLKECLTNLRQDRQKDAKMMHDLLLHSRELYLESINRITQKSSS